MTAFEGGKSVIFCSAVKNKTANTHETVRYRLHYGGCLLIYSCWEKVFEPLILHGFLHKMAVKLVFHVFIEQTVNINSKGWKEIM